MKFDEMSKDELVELLKGVDSKVGIKGGGKKDELLGILKSGLFSVKEISGMMGISSRNVSSVLCYLRDDGYEIRKIGKVGGDKLVLWGRIVGSDEKVGNRMVLGEKGSVVKFDIMKGCFEDEIKEEDDVEIDEV